MFFFLIDQTSAQTGILNYGEIQSMGMAGPVGQDYNAILIFDKNNSLYITRKDSLENGHLLKQKKFDRGDGTSSSITVVTNSEGFLYYFDLKSKTLYSRDLGFDYVKDTSITIQWKLTNERKEIGIYTVHKATAAFRGRNYTAWFTTQIPLPYGPWKLSGLPGLILEAYDTNKEIYWYFKNVEYPTKKPYLLQPIKEPVTGWISFEEYKNNLIKSYLDSQMSSRMVAENAGILVNSSNSNTIGNIYIEAFQIEQ